MADIATSVPDITAVNEPLLSPTPVTVPPLPAVGNRTTRIHMLLALFARRRGASMVVRENVAIQLEDWREDWGYSFPVVVVETLWNLAFVMLSVVTLFWIAREEKDLRLRVWICGYSMQCVVHVVALWFEYRKRNSRVSNALSLSSSSSSSGDDEDYVTNTAIRCELVNKVFSYLWWPIGFTWMLSSYTTPGNATYLLWLTLVFLGMDVFFAVLSFVFLCSLGVACCFCLPCIITFLCYTSSQGPASETDINSLFEYRFEVSNGDEEQPDVRTCRMIPMGTHGQNFSTERVLQTEDAECCICLCHYEGGEHLLLLPCNHHFHSTCIEKWLRLKASCPVCKSLVAPNE